MTCYDCEHCDDFEERCEITGLPILHGDAEDCADYEEIEE